MGLTYLRISRIHIILCICVYTHIKIKARARATIISENDYPTLVHNDVWSWLSAYRDACESVINKRVAVHSKKHKPEGSYRSNNHWLPCVKTQNEGIRFLTSTVIVIFTNFSRYVTILIK